jgi:hypothetical protein
MTTETDAIVAALRAIPPTPDGRWEWIPRRAAIQAAEMAGEDARTLAAMAESTQPSEQEQES